MPGPFQKGAKSLEPLDVAYNERLVRALIGRQLREDAMLQAQRGRPMFSFWGEELGFSGVVCTDDLTMGAITNSWGVGEAAVMALEAGCDLLLVCHGSDNLSEAYDALLNAVQEGRITETRLDESVGRILTLKQTYGVSGQSVPDPETGTLNKLTAELTQALP